MKRHIFTIREYAFVEANYKRLSDRQIGQHLGLSKESVRNFRNRQGWTKAKEACVSNKGQIPWNKGKSGYMGANRTSFKKGQPPANTTKHDGAISIRKDKSGRSYQFVRVALARWVPLHRYVWEQINGPLPQGRILIFSNGDSMDCRLDNIVCITRAEHARRNANRQKAAASMKRIWNIVKTMELYGLKSSKYKLSSFRNKA